MNLWSCPRSSSFRHRASRIHLAAGLTAGLPLLVPGPFGAVPFSASGLAPAPRPPAERAAGPRERAVPEPNSPSRLREGGHGSPHHCSPCACTGGSRYCRGCLCIPLQTVHATRPPNPRGNATTAHSGRRSPNAGTAARGAPSQIPPALPAAADAHPPTGRRLSASAFSGRARPGRVRPPGSPAPARTFPGARRILWRCPRR